MRRKAAIDPVICFDPAGVKLFPIRNPIKGRCKVLLVAALWLLYANVGALGSEGSSPLETQDEATRLSRLWTKESTSEAIRLFQKAARDWTRAHDASRAVFCLNEAAKLTQLSEYDLTVALLEDAIQVSKSNDLDSELVRSFGLLSVRALEGGDRGRAIASSQAALKITSDSINPTSLAYAQFAAGMFEYYYGTINLAIEYFDRAERESGGTDDSWLRTQILLYAGFARLRNAQPFEAKSKIIRAGLESEDRNYQKGRALAHAGLGYVYYSISEWQHALDSFQRADELLPTDFELIEKARVRSLVGEIYLHHDYLDLAKVNLEEGSSLFEKAGYEFGRAGSLKYLAEAYLANGESARAIETFYLARKIAQKLKDEFLLADINEGLGNSQSKLGHNAEAVEHYLKAIATYRSIGARIAAVQSLLGDAYARSGKASEARLNYAAAIETAEQTHDSNVLSEALYKLAVMDAKAQNFTAALVGARRSVEVTERLYSDVANYKMRRSYLSASYERFELLTTLLMETGVTNGGSAAYDGFLTAEMVRARTLSHALQISGADFTADADPETVRSANELRVLLNAKSDTLTDLLAADSDGAEIEKVRTEISVLEHRLGEAKAKLDRESPVYQAVKEPQPFDLKDFQTNVLTDDAILLEYFFGQEKSYLWLVGKSEFAAFVLPGRKDIETRIENLRTVIEARKPVAGETIDQMRSRIDEADARYTLHARELSEILLGPIWDKISGKRLIVVADGKLHRFPLSALPLPNANSDDPILLTNEVVYQPSAQTYSLLTKLGSKPFSEPTRDLLLFSDPVFSRDDSRLADAETAETSRSAGTINLRFAESFEGLVRLPASADEARSISDIVGGVNLFTSFAATRNNLLAADLANYKVIHLATHSLVNQERPELSAVVLSRFDEEGRQMNEAVRLQDIYAMKLNADLVVLSACQTAAGKEIKGEGVMGLNNAFLQAGARSVVASLWQVDDNASNMLMREFYRGLADGRSVSSALRGAQLTLYRDPQFSSPFYWAAFTLQGDMNRRPAIVSSRYPNIWMLAIPAALLITALGALVWRRMRTF